MLRLAPDSPQGHMATPFVAFLMGAVMMQILFGFCRALGGVVAQSSLMTIVHGISWADAIRDGDSDNGRAAGHEHCTWMGAQGAGLTAGYALLALLYTGATVSAIRARQLMR